MDTARHAAPRKSRLAVLPEPLRRRLAERADRFALERFAHMAEKHYAGIQRHPPVDDVVRRVLRDTTGGRELTADAFEQLYQPDDQGDLPDARTQRAIVDSFRRLYYHDSQGTWLATHYRGVAVWKCPLDLWVYQELLHAIRPGLVIETGTAHGGSAYFMADICDHLGSGRIVTVDIDDSLQRPPHDRVTYLTGSSTAAEIVATISGIVPQGAPVLLILDSDHSRDHVLEELRLLAPMVTPGSYAVVEDTNVNGHPVMPHFGPGPMEALDAFLETGVDFEIDSTLEKFHMTFNPRGFLRRRGG